MNNPKNDKYAELSDETIHIKIKGHTGTWYVIDTETIDEKSLFLLESEQYGDEAAAVIVDGQGNLMLDNVYNGFDDYREQMCVDEEQEDECEM